MFIINNIKYRIYIKDQRSGEEKKAEEYNTYQSAQKKIEKSYNKSKNKIARIVAIPTNVGIGFEMHLASGQFYGTIVRESEHLWFVKVQLEGYEEYETFLQKDGFVDKYVSGKLIMKDVQCFNEDGDNIID